MAKLRITIVLAVCFWTSIVPAQLESRRLRSGPRNIKGQVDPKQMIDQMMAAKKEKDKEVFRQKSRIIWRQYKQDIKQKLRASDSQWRLIEPRLEKVYALRGESNLRICASEISSKHGFQWFGYGEPDKALSDLWFCRKTEGKKIVSELVNLMNDPDAKDEQIRQKTAALQEARDKAKAQLRQARRELREVLNSPRQEAVLLIMGVLD